jgi:hypothetical protein
MTVVNRPTVDALELKQIDEDHKAEQSVSKESPGNRGISLTKINQLINLSFKNYEN